MKIYRNGSKSRNGYQIVVAISNRIKIAHQSSTEDSSAVAQWAGCVYSVLYCCLVQSLITNLDYLNTLFLRFIEVECQHIACFKTKAFKILA